MRSPSILFIIAVGLFVTALITPARAQQQSLMLGADTTTQPDGGIMRRVQVDPQGRIVTSGGGVATDGGSTISVPFCTVSASKNTTVGTSATAVPASLLAGRWMVRVCNSSRNSGTPIITCTSDGTTPTTASTSAGESLEVGDCAAYTTGSAVTCISDTASTAVTSEECK